MQTTASLISECLCLLLEVGVLQDKYHSSASRKIFVYLWVLESQCCQLDAERLWSTGLGEL